MSHMENVEYTVPTLGSVWETEGGTAKVAGVWVYVKYQFTDHDDLDESWGTSRELSNFLDVYKPAETKVEAGQTWVNPSGTEFYVYEAREDTNRVYGRANYGKDIPYADDYFLPSFQSYWELKK